MTFELPEGWKLLTVAELAGVGGVVADGDWIESKDQDPNGEVRLIQLADIGVGEFLNRSARFLTSQKARELQCTMLEPGDVLIARMPDPLGRACLFPGVGQQSITAVDVFIWRPGKKAADPRWLMHAINSPQVREHLQSIAGGTTRQRVSGGNLKRLTLPTPPKIMQSRIVDKLDSLLARSKSARDELSHIPKLIVRYKQMVLAAAYSEAGVAAKGLTTLGALAEEIRNGVSRRPENIPPGVPILKISAVRAMNVRMEERRYYVPDLGEDISRYTLETGDLLFTRYNGNAELVANCAMVRGLDGQLIYPDKLIRVRVDRQKADAQFVEALSSSPQARAALSPFIKSAAGQHGISGADLKQLPMPLPPLAMQRRIVRKIQNTFSSIDDIMGEALRAMALLDRLDRSFLAKAFRGELVAQASDPVLDDATVTESPRSMSRKRVPA